MKLLHISEPRCSGREPKTGAICKTRQNCLRHAQVDADRKLGISGAQGVRVMALPYVPGQDCHYFRAT